MRGYGFMLSRQILVKNDSGLDSKIVAKLIQKASSYKSEVWMEKDERRANAKSLLGVLSLSVARGNTIALITEGVDEQNAIDELEVFITHEMSQDV